MTADIWPLRHRAGSTTKHLQGEHLSTRALDPMPSDHATSRRIWWRTTGWPLRWKITVVLAVPLAVAVSLGGIRVQEALQEAATFSEIAAAAQMLPQVVELDNAAAIVAGTLAQRTVTADMMSRLDRAITTIEDARVFDLLDPNTARALNDAVLVSRSISSQAKTGPMATSILAEQRNSLRAALSNVVSSITEPITDPDVAVLAGQLADMWAAQRTLFEQGLSVVELTAILRGESTTTPDTEVWSFLATLRTEAALIEAPAQRYSDRDPNIATIRTEITNRTDSLRAHLGHLPDQGTLDDLKQSLFTSATGYTGAVNTASTDLQEKVLSKSAALRAAAWRDTALVTILLLGGIIVAAGVAVSLLQPLRRVRAGATQIAQRDLPAAIDRIEVGDESDSATIHRIDVHTDEELGQLARAGWPANKRTCAYKCTACSKPSPAETNPSSTYNSS